MRPLYSDLVHITDRRSARAFIQALETNGWQWGDPVDAFYYMSRGDKWRKIQGNTVFDASIETKNNITVNLLGETKGLDTKRNAYELQLRNSLRYKVTSSIIHILQSQTYEWEERLYIKTPQPQMKLDLSDYLIPDNLFENFL